MKVIRFTCLAMALCMAGLTLIFAQAGDINAINSQSRENEPDLKAEREKWIEEMHPAEPGVDWRIIEFANAKARRDYALSRQSQEKQMPTVQTSELVAGGWLKGTWKEKGSNNQAGRIHNVDIDWTDSLIYAASSGGNIWRGKLDGTGWTCLNNTFQIGDIRAVHIFGSGSSKRILVIGNGPSACYFTDNEGASWQTSAGLENAAKWGNLLRSARIDSLGIVYVLAKEWNYKTSKANVSIYRSNDSGSSFSKIYSCTTGDALCDIFAPRYGASDLYFIHKDTLTAVSKDDKFTNICNFSGLVDFSKATKLLLRGSSLPGPLNMGIMLANGDGKSYFFVSSDGGKSFSKRGSVDFGNFERNSFEVCADRPGTMFYGGVDTYKSLDSGATWAKINGWGEYYGNPKSKLHADIPSIASFRTPDKNQIIYITTDGGLFESKDYGTLVNNLSLSGLNVSQYYSSYTHRFSPQIVFAGAQDQGFQRCLNDSTETIAFKQTISGDYGHVGSSDGGASIWSVYPGFAMLYKNADQEKLSSQTWNLNDNNFKNWLWMPPIIADPADPQAAYIAAGGLNCADAGKCSYMTHLSVVSSKLQAEVMPFNFGADGSRLSAMAISPKNGNNFYALTSKGKFYYSNTKGADWVSTDSLKGPEAHYFYGSSIIASAKLSGKIIIAGSGYSNPAAFMSTNGGKTFARIDSALPKTLIHKIAISDDEKYIFAATEAGPYVYIDSKKMWFSLAGKDSPDQNYWSVEYIPSQKTARFCTYGRGLWDFRIEEEVSVAEAVQAVPNVSVSARPVPAGSSLTLALSSLQADSKIIIYDMSGRMIKSFAPQAGLADELLSWDLTDFAGMKVPQGNYICTVSAGPMLAYCKIIVE